MNRLPAAIGSAIIGSICGGMLASLANLISSSTFMVAATIIVAAALGGWLGRFWGTVNGAILGGMLAAFGSVIGGSVIGVVCVVSVCALLGGWLRWRSQERGNNGVTPQSLPSVDDTEVSRQQAYFAAERKGWKWTDSLAPAQRPRWNGRHLSRIPL